MMLPSGQCLQSLEHNAGAIKIGTRGSLEANETNLANKGLDLFWMKTGHQHGLKCSFTGIINAGHPEI